MIYFLFIASLIIYLYLNWKNFSYNYYQFIPVASKAGKPILNPQPGSIKFRMWLNHFISRKNTGWVITSSVPKWKIALVKGLSHFIGIFCCVAAAFCILQFWLDNSVDAVKTSGTVLQIEQMEAHLNKYIDYFKVGTGLDILIIFLLIFFSGIFPVIERYKLKDKYLKYNKWVKTISFVLMIATSFTFFGNSFSDNEKGEIAKLEQHKLEILKNSQLLTKIIQQDVREKVVNQILNDPQVSSALDQIDKIQKQQQEILDSKTYKDFAAVAVKSLLDNLTVNKVNRYDDFTNYKNDPSTFKAVDEKVDDDEKGSVSECER